MRPRYRSKENGPGAGHTKAAIGCSIEKANPKNVARRGGGLKTPTPRRLDQSTGATCDLMMVVARRLQRRHGLAWATAQVNACLAGLGGCRE